MKSIEIRRHSMRDKQGVHLSQQGVSLARRVGQDLGPFARVVTSTQPRAFETAIAMGFAVDEQADLMSSYGEEVETQVPWPQTFASYAQAVRRNGPAAPFAGQLARYYAGLVDSLAEDQAALAINHGGILELGVTAAFPDGDYDAWGGPADYCEGARLFWQSGKWIQAELIRIPGRLKE